MNTSAKMKMLVATFVLGMFLSVVPALASNIDAFIDRSNDRIFSTPSDSASFNLNVTVRNLDASTAISGLNITLPVGVRFTSLDSSTDVSVNTNSCRNITGFDANAMNGAGSGQCAVSGTGNTIDIILGSNLAAGSSRWFRLGVDGASGTIYSNATDGPKNFTIQATDTGSVLSSTSVYILTLKAGSIGFDIRNITNFPTTPTANRNSMVLNASTVRLTLQNSATNSNSSIKTDSNLTGLVFWTTGDVSSLLSSPTTFGYVIQSRTDPLRIPNNTRTYSSSSVNKDTVDNPIIINSSANLNVQVADELGTVQMNSTVAVFTGAGCTASTMLGLNETSPSRNYVNFSIASQSFSTVNNTVFVSVSKPGYVNSNCTTAIINNVNNIPTNISATGQGSQASTSIALPNVANTMPGMNYTVVINATDELTSFVPLSIVNSSVALGSSLQHAQMSLGTPASVYSANQIYLNLTGSGSLQLNTSGFVKVNTTVNPGPNAQTFLRVTLPFIIRLSSLSDEAGSSLTAVTGDNVTVIANSTQAGLTYGAFQNFTDLRGPRLSSGVWYFAVNNSGNFTFRYGKGGYLVANTTVVTANNTVQTNVTFANSTGTGAGLQPTVKLKIVDELGNLINTSVSPGNKLGNVTYYINITNTTAPLNASIGNITWAANSTTFGSAYFAIPQNSSNATNVHESNYSSLIFIVNKTGYLVNRTPSILPINNTTQAIETVTLGFTLKVSRIETELGNLVTADGTENVTLYNASSGGAASTAIQPINFSFAGGAIFVAAEQGNVWNVTLNKTGYIIRNATQVNVTSSGGLLENYTTQNVFSYVGSPNGLNYTLRVDLYDVLGNRQTSAEGNTSFQGVTNVTVINYSSGGYAYIAAAQNVTSAVQMRVNVTGFTVQNTSFTLAAGSILNYSKQANITYTDSSASGASGTGLNFTIIVDAVRDEFSSSLTQSSSDYLRVTNAAGATYTTIMPISNSTFGNTRFYIPVAPAAVYNVTYYKDGYITKNVTVGPTSSSYPTLANYTGGANGTALNGTLRINVFDEFNQSTGMENNITVFINSTAAYGLGFAPNSSLNNSYLIALTPIKNSWNLTVWRAGYVVTNASINPGLGNIGLSNTTQTIINFTGFNATGASSCVTSIGNATATCGGLNHSLRVTAQDELGTSLTLSSGGTTTFLGNTSGGSNSLIVNASLTEFSGGTAYVAGNSSGSGGNLEINHTGYIRTNTTAITTGLGLYQQAITYQSSGTGSGLPFTLKATVTKSAAQDAVNATVHVMTNSTIIFVYPTGNQTNTTHTAYFFPVNDATYTSVNASAQKGFVWGNVSSSRAISDTTQASANFILGVDQDQGKIDGYITSNATGTAVSGVSVSDGTRTVTSNNAGYYLITGITGVSGESVGTFTVTAEKTGWYVNSTSSVAVTAGSTTRSNISLSPNGTTINGYITSNRTGDYLADVTVSDGTRSSTSNSAGYYELTSVPAGTYTITATRASYITNTTSVTATVNSVARGNISLSTNDTTAPTITVVSPANSTNVTVTTPVVKFVITDNVGGSGIDPNTVAINVSGFNAVRDCSNIAVGILNVTCSFTPTLTNNVNTTLTIAAKDVAGISATNGTTSFGVSTASLVNLTFNSTLSKTAAVADGTYATTTSQTTGGFIFTFNITLGINGNATRFRMDDWCLQGSNCAGANRISVNGNAVMNYTATNGTVYPYNVRNAYNESEIVVPLLDFDSSTSGVQSSVAVYVRVPSATNPGTYTTSYAAGLYSVANSGG